MRRTRTIHEIEASYDERGRRYVTERWIKWPDKHRQEFHGAAGKHIRIQNGDRELEILPWSEPDEATLKYALNEVVHAGPFFWTESEIRTRVVPANRLMKDGAERGPDGKPYVVIELETSATAGAPYPLVSRQRYRFNPQTGLLIGRESWSERKDQPGRTWHRTVVDRIEYGLDLPDSLFSLEIPKGAILKYDYTTPEGLKEYLDGELARLERMPPEELAKWTGDRPHLAYWAVEFFRQRRQQLYPADSDELERRFRALGFRE